MSGQQECKIIRPEEGKEILYGEAGKFLELGLFDKEVGRFFDLKGLIVKPHISEVLCGVNADLLAESIGGAAYTLTKTNMLAILHRRVYPGKKIYYCGDKFFGYYGYPRIIPEIRYSSNLSKFNPVSVLDAAVQNGESGISLREFSRGMGYSQFYPSAKRLEILGFATLDGKIVRPKKISMDILSPENIETLRELWRQPYGMKVWP